jgi:sucrose-6-phosphate hydrolase SacC (GH32 family)
VAWDEEGDRWLLFAARANAVAVYQGKDLFHWQEAGLTLTESDLKVGMTGMNPGESPFVMRHPKSNKWIIFMNGGYSVSADPLDFPPIIPYPFKSGIYTFPDPKDEGKGTFYHADDDGAGFAHEIISFKGQWYMTGAVGVDGHTRLKFTPIEWTGEGFRLKE